MDHQLLVGILERVTDLLEQPDPLFDAELVGGGVVEESGAFDELHREV